MANQKKERCEIAAIVDDNGKCQGYTRGMDADVDMKQQLGMCKRAGIKKYQGATVVTGKDAEKAIREGRI